MWNVAKNVFQVCVDLWIGIIVIVLSFGIPIAVGIGLASFLGLL